MSELLDVEVTTPADTEAGQPEAGLWSDAWNDLKRNKYFVVGATIVLVMILMAAFPKFFTWFYPGNTDPDACSLTNSSNVAGRGRPSASAWFGFDIQGCDYYVRTILGARTALVIGLLVTTGTAIVGTSLGMVAGYYGGRVDSLIARFTDMVLAIPFILGALVLLSALGSAQGRSVFHVAGALVAFSWPTTLRLMRSSVLGVKEQDYIAASKSLGASDRRILLQHVLPNSIQPVIVYATLTAGAAIVAEATLSFLGVGMQLPSISWGLMIANASTRILNAPHLLLFPGLFLSVTVLGFLMMGDAVRDALDPKTRS